MVMTKSASCKAPHTLSLIACASSIAISLRVGSAPHSRKAAQIMCEFTSKIAPGFKSLTEFTISVPVGITAAFTFAITLISSSPAAIKAAISAGLMTELSGKTISPATISSPIMRTCCQGAPAEIISASLPEICTSSIMMTALVDSGIISPVSIR